MQPEPDPPACLPGEEPLIGLATLSEATRAFITADDDSHPRDDCPFPTGQQEPAGRSSAPRAGLGKDRAQVGARVSRMFREES